MPQQETTLQRRRTVRLRFVPAAFSHFTSLGFDRNRVLFSWDVTVDELHKYYTDVCVKGYDVVRHDRKRSGGGIYIYIRKSIRFVKRTDLVPENLEVACIEVTKPNGFAAVKIYDSIERMIGRIDNENKETYILGDLNCDLLDQANLDK